MVRNRRESENLSMKRWLMKLNRTLRAVAIQGFAEAESQHPSEYLRVGGRASRVRTSCLVSSRKRG